MGTLSLPTLPDESQDKVRHSVRTGNHVRTSGGQETARPAQ